MQHASEMQRYTNEEDLIEFEDFIICVARVEIEALWVLMSLAIAPS